MKKSVLTFRDSWIWLVVLAFAVGLTLLAFVYGESGQNTELAILLVVDFGVLAGTVWHYFLRWRWVVAWNGAYHTTTDTAVILAETLRGRVDALAICHEVEAVISACVLFWKLYFKVQASTLLEAFRGAAVYVTDQQVFVKYLGRVAGYQDGQSIVAEYPFSSGLAGLSQLIKHECSHLCLTAAGIDAGSAGEAHHAVFKTTEYC